ncbi:AMP-binding protein [Streptomyces sp. NPDC000070]|uniref:AMP-binding protein n=1 Tax=Streptomyces sp. NPDC000070 TaxID=3154240 RepID=UPI00332A97C7
MSQLQSRSDAEAMVGHGGRVTYAELAERTTGWLAELSRLNVEAGESVAIVGNASPHVVALFTALAVRGAVVVPFAPADPPEDQRERQITMGHATRVVEFSGPDEWTVRTLTASALPGHAF